MFQIIDYTYRPMTKELGMVERIGPVEEVTSTTQANWMRVASRLIGSNTLGLLNITIKNNKIHIDGCKF